MVGPPSVALVPPVLGPRPTGCDPGGPRTRPSQRRLPESGCWRGGYLSLPRRGPPCWVGGGDPPAARRAAVGPGEELPSCQLARSLGSPVAGGCSSRFTGNGALGSGRPPALGPRASADLAWAGEDGPHGADLRVPAPDAPRRHASPGFRRAALFCTEELGVRSPATLSRPGRRGEAGSRARRRWSPRPGRRPGHPRRGAHQRPRPRGCCRCRSRRRRVRPSRAR